MGDSSLIFPMLAMVLLTFGVLLTMLRTRLKLLAGEQIEMDYFGVYQGVEPESSLRLSRHFSNLQESPTLFYAACLAGMVTDSSSTVLLVLAWGYVVLRCVHTFIHTGRNEVQHRAVAYFASWFVLVGMWICLGVRAAVA